jgi:type II secretory ATPase GspE/PulE/Tfp pilus assembly ATPase PilB-like protein
MAEADATKPLQAAEYLRHLALLLGPAGDPHDESETLIVTVINQLFRLALERQAEEITFAVRDDDALEIRLRKGGVWTSLPPLAARGSAVSRLFVMGNLEKGEAARSRPQSSRAVIHGAEMAFETEPLGRWKENLRVRILSPI